MSTAAFLWAVIIAEGAGLAADEALASGWLGERLCADLDHLM